MNTSYHLSRVRSAWTRHVVWSWGLALLTAAYLPGPPAAHAQSSSSDPAARLSAAFSYDRPDQYGILRTNDILVPMRDGFRLTCDLYQPAGPDGQLAAGRFPSFVKDYTGYGRRDYLTGGSDFLTQTLAAKGYNVVWCNVRGSQGRAGTSPAPASIGLVQPWSEQEQQDNYDLIEWMAAQPWSNGKVGQTGGSYGGITTWLVAGRQRPPHLAAIAPIEASIDNYRHFTYPGGVASGDLRGLWPGLCSALTGDLTCSVRVPVDFAAHPNFDSFWEVRRTDLSKVTIPTLYVAGHMDIFAVSMDPIVRGMQNAPNFSLIFGPWAHEGMWGTSATQVPLGVLLAFFDRWLGDVPSTPNLPKYMAYQSPIVASDPSRWKAFNNWPPAEAQQQSLKLRPDGTLQPSAAGNGSVSYVMPLGSATFETAPFTSTQVVAGPVEVKVVASFDRFDAILFARIDDVDAAGNVTDMGYGGQIKLSHRVSDSNPSPIVPGVRYTLNISIPSKFWTVAAGHRLRLTIKSSDASAAESGPLGVATIHTGDLGSSVDLQLWQPN